MRLTRSNLRLLAANIGWALLTVLAWPALWTDRRLRCTKAQHPLVIVHENQFLTHRKCLCGKRRTWFDRVHRTTHESYEDYICSQDNNYA
jgi:hypothetical protein